MAVYFPENFALIMSRWDEMFKKLKSQQLDIPNFNTVEVLNLFGDTVNLLKLSVDMLDFMVNEEGINEENKFVLFFMDDTIEIVYDIITQINGKLPIFFEDITVFNEKLFEKLNQVKESFNSLDEDAIKSSEVDFNELIYVLREIEQTLDFLQVFAKKLVDKVA